MIKLPKVLLKVDYPFNSRMCLLSGLRLRQQSWPRHVELGLPFPATESGEHVQMAGRVLPFSVTESEEVHFISFQRQPSRLSCVCIHRVLYLSPANLQYVVRLFWTFRHRGKLSLSISLTTTSFILILYTPFVIILLAYHPKRFIL